MKLKSSASSATQQPWTSLSFLEVRVLDQKRLRVEKLQRVKGEPKCVWRCGNSSGRLFAEMTELRLVPTLSYLGVLALGDLAEGFCLLGGGRANELSTSIGVLSGRRSLRDFLSRRRSITKPV